MRNLFVNFGLLIVSILIFFIGIEFVLRVTGLQTTKPNPPLIFQQSEHSDISYGLKPDLRNEKAYKAKVSTNSLGFRSPELDPDKQTVAVFGDSITFGYGVNDDQTLTAHMSTLLPNFNIQNTAVPGYNLEMETGTLREKVVPLKPKLVVLVFYFNDLEGEVGILAPDGTLRPSNWDPSERDCRPIEQGILGYLPGKCWLDEHSAFYKAFKKVVDLRSSKQRKTTEQEQSEEKSQEDAVTEDQLTRYTQQLNGFIAHVPSGTPRIFVIWPDQYLHELSRSRIKQIAETRGFRVVDLYDIFSNKVETLPWDTVHPSSDALKAAAEVIVSTIEEGKLL